MLDASLATLLVLLQAPDIWTTNRILAMGGRELNPGVRLLMRLGSRWWWPKLAIALLAAGYMALSGEPEARAALVVCNAAYVLVILSNLRQMRKMEKMNAPRRSAPDTAGEG